MAPISGTASDSSTRASLGDGTRLVCPQCDRSGHRLGEACNKHRLFLVSARSLEEAPRGHPLGHFIDGKYAVLGMLGRGGMGTVYWAIQHPIGRRAAVKVLRSDLSAESSAEQRFLREARAIASVHHPHLVTCFDFGVEGKLAYMALEFLEGTTLEKVLQTQVLRAPEICHITRQILEGLATCHQNGIVHRDLKPANIMLCRVRGGASFVKIIDFGLVRLLEETGVQTITLHGDVFGSPLYMSPEQADGSHDVGPQTDVYALGVILYEMIVGRPPFEGSSPLNVLMKHMQEPLPPIVPMDGVSLVPGMELFARACLEKDQARRYKDGATALQAFDRLALPDSGPFDIIAKPDDRMSDLADSRMSIPSEGSIQLDVHSKRPGISRGRLVVRRNLSTLNRWVTANLVKHIDSAMGARSNIWLRVRGVWLRHRWLTATGALVILMLLTVVCGSATYLLVRVPPPDETVSRALDAAQLRVNRGHERGVVGAAQFGAEARIDSMVALELMGAKKGKRGGVKQLPAPRERDRSDEWERKD